MTDYVAGFAFSPDTSKVVMVRKNKPDWQKGLLNAPGGKIEPFDTSPKNAMIREFLEETSVYEVTWAHFATLTGKFGRVYFFVARMWDISHCKTTEEEEVVILPTDDFPYDEAIPNLYYLLPLARKWWHDLEPVEIREKE